MTATRVETKDDHARRVAATEYLNWGAVAPAIEKARAAMSKLRGFAGEAAAYAFYLHLDHDGSAPSWWDLVLDERREWAADTPLGFYARIYEPRAGA